MTKHKIFPATAPSTFTNTVSLGAQPATSHFDRALDEALEILLAGGLTSSMICDGSCTGVSSCCVAPVGSAGTLLAA